MDTGEVGIAEATRRIKGRCLSRSPRSTRNLLKNAFARSRAIMGACEIEGATHV
jgi:hypothetical protein